jgi:hypothetical protein
MIGTSGTLRRAAILSRVIPIEIAIFTPYAIAYTSNARTDRVTCLHFEDD